MGKFSSPLPLPNRPSLFNATFLICSLFSLRIYLSVSLAHRHTFPPLPSFTSSLHFLPEHQLLLFPTSSHLLLIYFQVRSYSSPPPVPSLFSCIPSIPSLSLLQLNSLTDLMFLGFLPPSAIFPHLFPFTVFVSLLLPLSAAFLFAIWSTHTMLRPAMQKRQGGESQGCGCFTSTLKARNQPR